MYICTSVVDLSKTRALALEDVEHVWLVRNSSELVEEHRRHARLPLVPTLVTPEGEALQDSTPMLEKLEQRHPVKSVYPQGTARFVCELLEEFGDERLGLRVEIAGEK